MFQSRSAAAAQKTAVASQASAPAMQVRQSGLAPASNKVNIVVPKSALPAAPFSSSSGYIDFEIPNTTGKLVDVQAEWTLAFSSADASGTDVAVMPTPFFTQKVEILYDGESVETVEAQEAFQESIVWTTDQEYALNRTRWNISSAGNLNAAFNVAANATVTKTWYQPLNANFLMRMEPYIRGFTGVWTFRMHFAPNIVATAYKTGTAVASAVSVSLAQGGLRLFTTEAALSREQEAALVQSHIRGSQYKTITRSKWQSGTLPSVSNASLTSVQITGFKGSDSAAILVYLQKANPTLAAQLQHPQISQFQIKDAAGSEKTKLLPEAVIQQLESKQISTNSVSFSSNTNNLLWSFCSHLGTALKEGRFLGRDVLSGSEFVLVQPVSAQTDVLLYVVSYDYATLVVQGGRAQLIKKLT